MSDRHASLYLASRIAAAALNLVSVMVFTRLASPEVYGSYLVGLAVSFMIFGGAFQWLLYSHFGLFTPAGAPRQAGALVLTMAAATVPSALLLAAATGLGLIEQGEAVAVGVLVTGMTMHLALIELGRVRLLVREVTAASVLRGVLTLVAGTLTLLLTQSAPMLLVALGLAQLLATVPLLPALAQHGIARPQRQDIVAMLRYGWPLLPALCAGAVAISLDRVVLEHQAGAAAAGAYGAASDLIRQGFVVMGEAIAAAYISQAKAARGEREAMLARAFVTLWSIVLFGVVAWLLLGRELAAVVLGPGFALDPGPTLPLLVAGTALLALRAYYFGQAIYFSGTASREVGANLAMLGLAGTALVLVPLWGGSGAALAFALAQAGALAVFLWTDRHSQLMPADALAAGTIALWCTITAGIGWIATQLNWWMGAAVILASAAGLAWRFDLFGTRAMLVNRQLSSRRQ